MTRTPFSYNIWLPHVKQCDVLEIGKPQRRMPIRGWRRISQMFIRLCQKFVILRIAWRPSLLGTRSGPSLWYPVFTIRGTVESWVITSPNANASSTNTITLYAFRCVLSLFSSLSLDFVIYFQRISQKYVRSPKTLTLEPKSNPSLWRCKKNDGNEMKIAKINFQKECYKRQMDSKGDACNNKTMEELWFIGMGRIWTQRSCKWGSTYQTWSYLENLFHFCELYRYI